VTASIDAPWRRGERGRIADRRAGRRRRL